MNENDEKKIVESMTAADVMTAAPLTCSTFSTVLEAVMIFRDADCGAAPILEEGKPVAILTDRDIALGLAEYPDLVNRPVSEIMTPGIVAVAAEDSWVRSARCSGPRRCAASWSSTRRGGCSASSAGPTSRRSCRTA